MPETEKNERKKRLAKQKSFSLSLPQKPSEKNRWMDLASVLVRLFRTKKKTSSTSTRFVIYYFKQYRITLVIFSPACSFASWYWAQQTSFHRTLLFFSIHIPIPISIAARLPSFQISIFLESNSLSLRFDLSIVCICSIYTREFLLRRRVYAGWWRLCFSENTIAGALTLTLFLIPKASFVSLQTLLFTFYLS